jgi:hypothetical protein
MNSIKHTMGIDFYIYSKTYPTMIQEDDPNTFLGYALGEIQWKTILDLLHINLAENSLRYWCPEQVEHIYKSICELYEKGPYWQWPHNELEPHMLRDIETATHLKSHTLKLRDYFKYLVDHNAYIGIC